MRVDARRTRGRVVVPLPQALSASVNVVPVPLVPSSQVAVQAVAVGRVGPCEYGAPLPRRADRDRAGVDAVAGAVRDLVVRPEQLSVLAATTPWNLLGVWSGITPVMTPPSQDGRGLPKASTTLRTVTVTDGALVGVERDLPSLGARVTFSLRAHLQLLAQGRRRCPAAPPRVQVYDGVTSQHR